MNQPLAVLTALAFAVIGVVAVAPTAAASTGKTISVVEHPITDETVDVGKKGDSNGDILTFANPIFNSTDTKKVATDQGYCIRVKAGVSYECTWTNFFKGGQIVVQGPFFDAKASNLAIIGGTGKYARARGWMHLKAIHNEEEFSFVFHIR